MSYVEEYRASLPTSELEPTKLVQSYDDLVYEHARVALLRQWQEIQRSHAQFGCPLEPKDGTFGVCVIHGAHRGAPELTREQFLGSFASPIRQPKDNT